MLLMSSSAMFHALNVNGMGGGAANVLQLQNDKLML